MDGMTGAEREQIDVELNRPIGTTRESDAQAVAAWKAAQGW